MDIFSLIQSIINNQEEKLKEMKITNKSGGVQDFAMPGSLSDVAVMLMNTNLISKENKNCTIIADKSNINYNEVNKKISKIIKQVIEEFNKQVLRIEETNINNSIKKNSKNINNFINNYNNNSNLYSSQNIQNDISNMNNNNSQKIYENQNLFQYQELNKSANIANINLNSIKNEEDEANDFESKLNNGLNPSKLILNIEEEISQDNLVKSLQYNLQIENCFVLPFYDYNKLMNTTFDLNSVEYNSKNAYYNIFPQIENDERKLAAKKLLDELEVQTPSLANKNKKNMNIDYEQTTRYMQLTPLQKLIILYGIFNTGNNPFLINCLLNVYYPTHCIMYSIDEMNYISRKILEEVGIEYEYNFCNIKEDIFNFDQNNKYFLNNSQRVDIESALYISEYTDFEYNNTMRKIFNLKDDNNKDEYNQIYNNIRHKDQYKLSCEFNLKNKNLYMQRAKVFTNIITQNPYLTNKELKKKILSELVNYLKKLCQKIKEFQKNNKSKFNYFTGEEAHDNTRQINDLNYKEIIDNKNKTLNKNDVLRQLREHKNEFKTYSIKQIKQKLIKKEINNKEEDIKTKILNVINTYSEYNIKNEWETMRKVWYQNNQRFNPIFKFNDKIEKLNEAVRKSASCNFSAGEDVELIIMGIIQGDRRQRWWE